MHEPRQLVPCMPCTFIADECVHIPRQASILAEANAILHSSSELVRAGAAAESYKIGYRRNSHSRFRFRHVDISSHRDCDGSE